MYRVEIIKDDICKNKMFEHYEDATKCYSKEVKKAVDAENATIRIYCEYDNGSQGLFKECVMVSL